MAAYEFNPQGAQDPENQTKKGEVIPFPLVGPDLKTAKLPELYLHRENLVPEGILSPQANQPVSPIHIPHTPITGDHPEVLLDRAIETYSLQMLLLQASRIMQQHMSSRPVEISPADIGAYQHFFEIQTLPKGKSDVSIRISNFEYTDACIKVMFTVQGEKVILPTIHILRRNIDDTTQLGMSIDLPNGEFLPFSLEDLKDQPGFSHFFEQLYFYIRLAWPAFGGNKYRLKDFADSLLQLAGSYEGFEGFGETLPYSS